MKARAWVLALVVNVAVSAGVTWAVLAWWSRTHPCPPAPPTAPAAVARPEATASSRDGFPYVVQPGDTWEDLAARFGLAAADLAAHNGLPSDAPLAPGQTLWVPGTPPPTPTGDPAGLTIAEVLGAGNLADERVRLRYQGAAPLNLSGWTLEDQDGHRFIFPAMILYPDGMLQVWTKAGTNTAEDVYWGLEEAVWRSGETVVLRTPAGWVAGRYQVP